METGPEDLHRKAGDSTDEIAEELFEHINHSFTIDLWRERPASAERKSVWRGHISHIPSGRKRYVKSLDDITAVIASYLEETKPT